MAMMARISSHMKLACEDEVQVHQLVLICFNCDYTAKQKERLTLYNLVMHVLVLLLRPKF